MLWANIAGAGLSWYQGQQAQQAAERQNAANIAAQERWNALADPFTAGGSRAQYVSQLNDLMHGGYANIQNDPMYQWMQRQGQEQLQRGMSAHGGLGSGAEQLALQQQGFGLANDFFNQQYSRLADLSGATRGGGQAAIGMSPSAMYQMQMNAAQNKASAFGLGLQGMAQIFGQGAGTTPTPVYSGQYNPNSYGTYDPNPNGLNPNG